MAILVAATAGLFDNVSSDDVAEWCARVRIRLPEALPELVKSVEGGEKLGDAGREALLKLAAELKPCKPPSP
jgi:hypothetical protein